MPVAYLSYVQRRTYVCIVESSEGKFRRVLTNKEWSCVGRIEGRVVDSLGDLERMSGMQIRRREEARTERITASRKLKTIFYGCSENIRSWRSMFNLRHRQIMI